MKPRILFIVLLCLGLVASIALPHEAGQAQEPPARWIPFEMGNLPSPSTLNVTASDSTRVELSAYVPGCFATEIAAGGETYTRLMGEGFGFGTQVGAPDLPVLRQGVEVPFGAQVSLQTLEVQMTEYDLSSWGIHQPLYPLQPSQPKDLSPQEPPPFALDTELYHTAAFYPAQPLRLAGEYTVRGRRVVVVELWPLAYNPVTGKVRVYSDVTFRLALSGSDMVKTASLAERYASPGFDARLAQQLLNYNQGRQNLYDLGSKSSGYLIITTDAYYNAMLPFVTLKTNQGLNVTMTKVSEIAGGATTSAIKTYIQNAYDTWSTPPSYVLLVGDTNTIPGWNSVAAGEITDLYYGTMDGTSDWVPDIERGRFPVRSAAQATIMVNKALAYAGLTGNEEWLKKIAFIGTCDQYTVAEGSHNYVINTYTQPEDYTGIFPNNPQPGGDRLYCITHNATSGDIQTSLNEGRWAAIYSGHGGHTGWEMGYGSGNVQSLTNFGMFPFVASHACVTGDFAQTEVYGETWVLQDNKGALAFWGSSDSSYWGEDDVLERATFDALFAEGNTPTVGAMTDAGLAAVQTAYPSSARYYWETYNILGDPALALITAAPDFTLDVSPPAREVSVSGIATYTVEVGQILDYSDNVTLTITGLPGHSQASFTPPNAAAPFTAGLNVTTTLSTPEGVYDLTIVGTAGDGTQHSDQVQLTVYPSPDLTLTKTPSAGQVEIGTTLQYTLIVENAGGPATGIVISDTLPTHTQFAWAGDGGALQGGAVVWDGLNLPGDETLTVSYDVTVTCVATGTQIINDDYQVTATEWPTLTVGAPVTVTASDDGVTADFIFPVPALTGWPVAFTNLSTNATGYSWAFGDGDFSTAVHPQHTYGTTGEHTVILTATNICHSVVASQPLTVENYAVALHPAMDARHADPDEVVTYTLQVTNTGTLSDTFALNLSGNVWPTQLAADALALDVGETATVTVSVEIPYGTAGGVQDEVVVTVYASSDPRPSPATAEALFTTTANTFYGVTLDAAVPTQATGVGETVTYTLEVVNTSNALDTITFSRVAPDWPTAFSRDSMAIAAGGIRQIQVYISVPLTATAETPDNALIRAVGSGDPSEVTLTTRVATFKCYLPLVMRD